MNEIKGKLGEVVEKLYGVGILVEISVAPEGQKDTQGRRVDYATNLAMRLAGELKRVPREIAEEIREEFLKDSGGFDAEVAGAGFLNFVATDEYFKEKIEKLGKDFLGEIRREDYKGKVVVSEFSDPNPFKVLHVGHLYTSIVGEAISRLVEFAGGEVKRANFGGDVGLHVAKTIYSLLERILPISSEASQAGEPLGVGSPHLQPGDSSASTVAGALQLHLETGKIRLALEELLNTDMKPADVAGLLAECYVEGTRAYEEDEEAKGEIMKLNKQIYEIAEKGLHDSELAELYWWGREASYKYFEEFYDSIGVKFDKFYPESTVAGKGLSIVRKQLEKGVYEMSDGAVVFRGEPYGLHTRVFINKEWLPTYEAKDVGLIHQKWDDYHFDESLVITGNDIVDYMKVVLKSVEQYSPELVRRTKHITHGNVKLKGGVKMSSRKGNFLKAIDVIQMVREALGKEREGENEMIVLGAIKYAFLKYKIGGDIIFSPEESVKMTGNSGVYLQYAAVRARKILASLDVSDGFSMVTSGWKLDKFERDLMRKILEYKEVLGEAVAELAPHKVCAYLYELAQEFNRFYENVRVRESEFEAERAGLTSVYLSILMHGLNLLGIEIPEEM